MSNSLLDFAKVKIPTIDEWKNLTLPDEDRKGDAPILYIDDLVSDYATKSEIRPELLFRMRLACRSYLKQFKTTKSDLKPMDDDRRSDKDRSEGVTKLAASVDDLLRIVLFDIGGHTPKDEEALEKALADVYGQSMVHERWDIDEKQKIHYFDDAERRVAKLMFRKGLAYRVNDGTWTVGKATESKNWKVDLFDTEKAQNENGTGKSNYVMDGAGKIYATFGGKQRALSGLNDQKHSTVLGGKSAVCAGTIAVTKGQVVSIGNDSGHYQPKAENLARAVARLKAYGVDLSKVTVEAFCFLGRTTNPSWARTKLYAATDFLAMNGDLVALDKAGKCQGGDEVKPFKSLMKKYVFGTAIRSDTLSAARSLDDKAKKAMTIIEKLDIKQKMDLPKALEPVIGTAALTPKLWADETKAGGKRGKLLKCVDDHVALYAEVFKKLLDAKLFQDEPSGVKIRFGDLEAGWKLLELNRAVADQLRGAVVTALESKEKEALAVKDALGALKACGFCQTRILAEAFAQRVEVE